MKKNLILATECFPFGRGEKPLIQTELDALIENFNLTIVSHAPRELLEDKENRTQFGENVKVVNIDMNMSIIYKFFYSIRFFLDLDGWREIISILKTKKKFFTCLYQSMGYYVLAMYNWRQMRKQNVLEDQKDTIYYSYWFFYYTYSITKFRKKFKNLEVVTRVHGFDLYNERYKGERQPFRKQADNRLDRILFVCETAKQYYINQAYSRDVSRYLVARMGTKLPVVTTKEKETSANFILVSCSNLIELKRIPLIIKALAEWDGKRIIEWHHFGDGENKESIVELAEEKLNKKSNICYYLHGFTPHDKVMKFYSENRIDCFINVSETEGCPVSIQEAMSYWIPIIGTNVGGVSELIQGNGILLNADVTAEEVYQAIKYLVMMPEDKMTLMRTKSYEIWEKLYQSDENASKLVKIFEGLVFGGKENEVIS